jgi:hypothetical protein
LSVEKEQQLAGIEKERKHRQEVQSIIGDTGAALTRAYLNSNTRKQKKKVHNPTTSVD